MRAAGLIALMLLGTSCGQGMSREGGVKALVRDLAETKVLELLRVEISDRGPFALFRFRTDHGRLIDLKASPPVSLDPGAPRVPELLISPHADQTESELMAGSPMEQRLLHLLETCAIASADPADPGRPTRERVEWLLARMKDRSLKWSPPP